VAELIIEDPRSGRDYVEVAATYTSSAGRYRLWYRVDEKHREALAVNADPFVIGLLPLAMNIGEPLHVAGPVSPSLLENLESFQEAWSAWKPRSYQQVKIDAEVLAEPELPEREEAISGFSGGVDSAFTVYRHAKGVTTRYPKPLKAAVMVHGFDIPLDDPDGYQRASRKAVRQLDSLGIELIRVATNYREQPVHWPHAFGAAVASVLSLFQGRFNQGLIAQGIPFAAYHHLVEGSNSLTDSLLSSGAFKVLPDGAGFQRYEKLAALAAWREGLDELRVCWRNPIHDENCCVCEKCIRTILSFRAAGLDLPRSFPKDVSNEQILGLVPIANLKISVGFGPILKEAERRGLQNEPWVRTLRRAIQLSHRKRLYGRVRRRLGFRA